MLLAVRVEAQRRNLVLLSTLVVVVETCSTSVHFHPPIFPKNQRTPKIVHSISNIGWNRKITNGVGRNNAMTMLVAQTLQKRSKRLVAVFNRSAIFSRVLFSSSALYQPLDVVLLAREGGRENEDESAVAMGCADMVVVDDIV